MTTIRHTPPSPRIALALLDGPLTDPTAYRAVLVARPG